MLSLAKHSKKALLLLSRGYGGYVNYRLGRMLRALQSRAIRGPAKAIRLSSSALSGEKLKAKIDIVNESFSQQHKWAVVLHLYYPEIFFELITRPFFREKNCDFFISLPQEIDEEMIDLIHARAGNVKFFVFENRGRDVLPFLKIFPELKNYEWIAKAHSKKSPTQIDGDIWRQDLYDSLFGETVVKKLEGARTNVSMMAPYQSLLDADLFMAGNLKNMVTIFDTLNQTPKDFRFPFVAGTMFWVRPRALEALGEASWSLYFEEERGLKDGAMAHAFERIFCKVATNAGGKVLTLPRA